MDSGVTSFKIQASLALGSVIVIPPYTQVKVLSCLVIAFITVGGTVYPRLFMIA